MNEKVILISIDGMRPDGAVGCGHPFVQELMEKSTYTLQGGSVLPPVTLPCHTSMFYGVPPERHGILTNTYTPSCTAGKRNCRTAGRLREGMRRFP